MMKKYRLSEVQKGVFAECMAYPGSTQYNVVLYVDFDHSVDVEALRDAWVRLIRSKAIFRNRLEVDESGEAWQWPDEAMPIEIPCRKCTEAEALAYKSKGFIRPFDVLAGEPLFRVEILETEEHVFLLTDFHHLIFDGVYGRYIYGRELNDFYGGKEKPSDYAYYELCEQEPELFATEAYRESKSYFQKGFREAEFVTLSQGSANPEGQMISFATPVDKAACDAWCREHKADTAYLFQAAFSHVLGILARQEDISYMTSYLGRSRREMSLAGMFVRQVPVHANISGDVSVMELIAALKEDTEAAISHSVYPLTHFHADLGLAPKISFNYRPLVSLCKLGQTKVPVTEPLRGSVHSDIAVHIELKDGCYEVFVDSSAALYSQSFLRMFSESIAQVVRRMMAQPFAKLKDISLLSETAAAAALELSKGESLPYDESQTFVDLFLAQAVKQPEQAAVVDAEGSYTYGELDEISNRLAAYLLEQGIKENSFVAIKMGRCKEFLAAVLGIQKAGAAYVPLDPEYPQERLDYMVEDSESALVVTEEMVRELQVSGREAAAVNLATPSHFAYMIYTSGSTGKPKGVMQSHRSLRAFVAWRLAAFGIGEGRAYAQHASFAFDASLDDLICPLAAGGTVHILSEELRKDMDGMRSYFAQHHIYGLTLPTQMGMAMLEQYADLPLQFLMMGGEKMLPFRKTGIRVINGYGPTEFTVCSSYHVVNQEKDQDIPIGRPVPNTWSLIVDRNGHLLPQGAVGELCLAGPQIASGYWKLPELTEEKFASLADGLLDGRLVYHTGDLARYNESGELEYLGRIDFQVKLRGFRIELGEIEAKAAAFAGMGMVCAQVRHEQLVLYYMAGQQIDKEELCAFLTKSLTEYMVPTVYMQLDEMPLTPNGKIDRKKLPEPELAAEEIVEPANEREQALLDIAKQYVSTDKLGVTSNLVSLGLTSLAAIRLSAEIAAQMGSSIKVAQILNAPTVREMAASLKAGESGVSLHAYPQREIYPLTENQRGIYVDWEMNRETTQYNIPGVYRYENIEAERLAEAVKQAVNAHAVLKTRLVMRDGDVMQQPHPEEEAVVSVMTLEEAPDAAFFQSRILPFDLFNDRLYRLEIYAARGTVYLFADIHHIVYDGLSLAVMMEDIKEAYEGRELLPEEVTAYDFALYEQELFASEAYQEAEARYDKLLSEASGLQYPDSLTKDRVAKGTVSGTVAAEGMDAYCTRQGITLNSFLQAAFAETLYRLTREEHLAYLTVNHGRGASATLARSVGMFVKTLPVVLEAGKESHGKALVADYVRDIHAQLQESYGLDFYPYTRMVERHGFQSGILFVYQGGLEERAGQQELPLSLDTNKLALEVTVYHEGAELAISIQYDGSRYGKSDMSILLAVYAQVLRSMLSAEYVSEIRPMSEAAEQELVHGICQGEAMAYDKSQTVVDLFLKQVAVQPEHLAVQDAEGSYTYGELDRASNAVAQSLLGKGIQPKDFVIIKMDRVKEYVAAVLGIQKAGACYVPVDPNYPEERIKYMVEDSEAKVVLTETAVQEMVAENPAPAPVNLAKPEHYAYMIYTSGSTGKPKGAMLPHSALMNYTLLYIRRLEITPDDRMSHHITWSFDSHIRDLFPAMAGGAALYIMPEAIRREPDAIAEFLDKYEITGGGYATAMGQALLSGGYKLKQRFMTLAGEALRGVKAEGIKVYNGCAATECTDIVVEYLLKDGVYYDAVPIGKPLPNCYAFIVDVYGHLLPQGASGEICYAGPHVGAGYWHLPEKTREVFVDCPFVPGERMYHAGDLCRYNEDGDVEYLGRLDHQVKLRGFRIELGEVESNAIQYEGMKQVVAAVKQDQLVLYYTAEQAIGVGKLRAFLAESLTDYMVPTVYMQLEEMPMTPSGKIDRKKLPEPEITAEEIIAPANDTEAALLEIAQKHVHKEELGVTSNLVSLGLTSISAIRFSAEVKAKLDIHLKVAQILKTPTVRELAASAAESEAGPVLHACPAQEYYPLTENQRGIYVDWELNRETTQYNVPGVYRYENLDAGRLAEAVKQAVNAHAVLKTRLVVQDGDVMQQPHPEEEPLVTVAALQEVPDSAFFQSRILPFDLFSDNLYRFEIYAAKGAVYLFTDIHHIIYDGLSIAVLMGDIMDAYAGKELAGEEVTAYDFALYEQELFASPAYQEAEARYDKLLSEASGLQYPDSTVKEQAALCAISGKVAAEGIDAYCTRQGITRNSFLQAAFAETLYRLTREENLAYLTINHGRGASAALARSVGMFVKTLPVVLASEHKAHGKTLVSDYVRDIHAQLQESYGLDFYPYTRMVERHGFQSGVLFIYQGGLEERAGQQEVALALDTNKLPVEVTAYAKGTDIAVSIQYDGSRYGKADMSILLETYAHVLRSMLSAERVEDIRLLDEEAARAMVQGLCRGESLPYDRGQTFVDLFLAQARSHPGQMAVVDCESFYTYGELDRISDLFAGYLVEQGVKKNSFVAVRMGRRKEFTAAVLGIHKAGAAYVPIDPDYPQERIDYMIEDSGSALVVTDELVRQVAQSGREASPINLATPENLAYMIYTSGSTGKPKGVMQSHRSLRAYMEWMMHDIPIEQGAVYAEHATYSFDISIDGLWTVLGAGGTTHILSEELRRDLSGMRDYFARHGIRGVTMSTQIGMAILNAYPDLPVEYLLAIGEKLHPVCKTPVRIINAYGPTEFTVTSSYHVVDQEVDAEIPIGRPVPNTWSVVVDSYGHLLPQGAVGELCLSGPQIADGYWQRPELNKERFAPLADGILDGQPAYRTGDLVRYNENNELEYLGRIDFQVKLRGFRIELGEIEARASAHPGLGMVCAQVKQEQLVLYYTAKEAVDKEELKGFLARTLTEYMVPDIYVQLEKMPMTGSGKIDRKKLPEPELAAEEIVEPVNECEAELLEIAKKHVHSDNIGVTSNLVSLGLTSLAAIRLSAEIAAKLNKTVKAARILKSPTVRAMAGGLSEGEGGLSLHAYAEREVYPLTENQRGIYVDWELNPETTQYNIPGVYRYEKVEANRLAEAVKQAVSAHAALKMRLVLQDGDVMQQPHPEEEPVVSVATLQEVPDQAFFQSRILPFDLFSGPLYRFEIYEAKGAVYLFADIHHIAYDGLSVSVLMEDIKAAYEGRELLPEEVTAYDFALYEQELFASAAYQEAEARYDKLLSEAVGLQYPDSAAKDQVAMGTVSGQVETEGIEAYCTRHGITLGSFLQAAFAETLYRLTREEHLAYLTINHGRGASAALARCVGMFVKTLPVVLSVEKKAHGKTRVADYVRDIHAQLQESYGLDFYPYTRMVERHGFQSGILFVYQGGLEERAGQQEMTLAPDTNKLPIEVMVYPQNEGLAVSIQYDGNRYGKTDMSILLSTYVSVLRSMLSAELVEDVRIMDRKAEQAMVQGLCRGETLAYDKSRTFVDLFLTQSGKQPEHLAVADANGSYTYGELDRASDAIAQSLLGKGIQPNDFVIIKMDRVKEFVAAVLGIQKAGACYVPVDPQYPEERIHYMVEDSEAKAVLTEAAVQEMMAENPAPAPVNRARPENYAYMIYTSGSTGRPKGAMLPHSALMNYTVVYVRNFELTAEDRVSHHITWSFDSHIRDLFPALAAGASLHIMPESIRREPDAIAEFLEENAITGGAYATAIGKILLTGGYCLKQRFMSLGGEALRGVKAEGIKVFNVCAATECTDVVLEYVLQDGVYYDAVPLGKPLPNCYAFVVDPYGHLLPQGAAGEICYGGAHVGAGYWHLPERTQEAFVDCPFVPGEKMYHAGDLGRYNENGDMEYLGRLDHQVKLRGFRIELGEIESTAIKYEGMKQVVAVVCRDQLVLYYTAEQVVGTGNLRVFLAESLTDYMVPTVYMQLEEMPMTPSGKIDRKKLPEPEIAAEELVQPANDTEAALLDIAKKHVHKDEIGVTSNLVSLGLTSISAIRLGAEIASRLNIHLKVAQILKTPTVRELAEKASQADSGPVLHAYPARDYYPLTENQRGIYVDWELNRETAQYNIPGVYRYENVEAERLAEAVKQAVNNHAVLKTRLVLRDGDIMQQPHPEEEPAIAVQMLEEVPEAAFFQSRIRPFDLLKERLYRIEIYVAGGNVYLFMDVHHIVYDGMSVAVLLEDIRKAYGGREILPEEVTAYDFALYEQELLASAAYQEAEARYDKLLSEANGLQYPDSADKEQAAGTVHGELEAEGLAAYCTSQGITVNSFLQAAFAVTLQRLTREEQLAYLTINHGRGASSVLARSVGMFVKTLPVVLETGSAPLGEQKVADYVRDIHAQLQESYGLDFYPYTRMVERHGFQSGILFVYQGGLEERAGQQEIALALDKNKLPLEVTVYPLAGREQGTTFAVSIDYDGSHYGKADMSMLLAAFTNVVCSMLAVERVKDIRLLSEDVEQELLKGLCQGKSLPYDDSQTFVDLFLAQAEKQPGQTAVVDAEGSYTYGELDGISNRLAVHLIEQGVKENSFVAVKMGRRKEFVAAILGIQKAGAAYVPLDPEYPQERLDYMVEDSESALLVTGEMVREIQESGREAAAVNLATPSHLAYMIYTSGSTGKPKGVMQSHRSLRAFVAWRLPSIPIEAGAAYAQYTSFAFDASLDDLICPLAAGGTVHILSEDLRQNMEGMRDYFGKQQITGLTLPTQMGMAMLEQYADLPLQFLMMGGEKMLPFRRTDIRVINGYGPTEFTVCSSYHVVNQENDQDIPIGRPVPNTWSLIVDSSGHLLPQGAVGELCLAGPQLSAGYWKQPELTKEKFAPLADGILAGRLVYHTGDLARYNENGELEYVGRTDFQVKLRGFRIELGEIEAKASVFADMGLVCAQVRQERLVLYYTAGQPIPVEKLRAFLAESLAAYMVPMVYMQLDEMPLTPNGKIDRKQLPEPELETREIVPPANEQERICLALAKKFLPNADFGVTDDLFYMGLSSLSAMKLAVSLQGQRMRIRTADIMRYRTIRSIMQGRKIVAWLYEEYDANKPVMVFVAGIIPLRPLLILCKELSRSFNILLFEPVQDHYERMFGGGEDFDDAVEFYLMEVELLLEGAPVVAFLGFSYGGMLAAHMAMKWQARTGIKTALMMGDTYFEEAARYAKRRLERSNMAENKTAEEIRDYQTRIAVVDKLGASKEQLRFDGQTVYLNAMRDMDRSLPLGEEEIRLKKATLENSFRHVKVMDMEAWSHEDLFQETTLFPMYREQLLQMVK